MTSEMWRNNGIIPRGSMREISEMLSRTHMGMDQDYKNITKQISRTALSDGWGSSMVATEISDILFGTPSPVSAKVNMGVLKEDHVNIIVHGHKPTLIESMLVSANNPVLIESARKNGAKGINLAGMCSSGAEALSRHGIPNVGNFSSAELVIVTGAVDAIAVDVQCIQQGLVKVAECYNTPFITTNSRCRLEGAEHIDLNENNPQICTDEIVTRAINRFKNRRISVEIPDSVGEGVQGFSHEYINYLLGGSFISSYPPLNENIINGRIRGVVGVIGCTNPRVRQDQLHVELVGELIRNDVLVLQTGCSQIALAKIGMTSPSAAMLAGDGLREVCETVGMPPVLGLGACVDNTRILVAYAEMVHAGGLGSSIADLPVGCAAPEFFNETAIVIGQYFVASGIFTIYGAPFPTTKDTKFENYIFNEIEKKGIGKWNSDPDPYKMAKLLISHIDKKRKCLGIDKARERLNYEESSEKK